jgi:hypothetical protein
MILFPQRNASETAKGYHERLRKYCEDTIGRVDGFVLYDGTSRYQINLPKWLSELPKENPKP